MVKRVIRIAVTPGKAGGPALQQLNQQLSQFGIDVKKVVDSINEKTKVLAAYGFNQVYVEVEFDENTKEFDVKVELPDVSEFILRAIGKPDGAHAAMREVIGDLNIEKAAEIAYIKWDELKGRSFKGALKQVVSTCRSIGVTVNGKDPKVVLKEIDEGLYDDLIKRYEELLKKEGRL